MADATAIQWTDSTWNIVTGCTRVSPGCAHCYIERTPPFRMAARRFQRSHDGVATTGVQLHWDRLERVPRGPKVFTPSLGDLFHEAVPEHFIQAAFEVMAAHPDRIFQVLTKRPERALEVLVSSTGTFPSFTEILCQSVNGRWSHDVLPPNVWLGVSIENARHTYRADVLREIPAAVRFISAEPLLGSLFNDPNQGRAVDSSHPMGETRAPALAVRAATARQVARSDDEASPARANDPAITVGRRSRSSAPLDLSGIDWIIVGGESGPGARPFHLEHAREIIRAAGRTGAAQREGSPAAELADLQAAPDAASSVAQRPAVFVKQLGAQPVEAFRLDPHAFATNERTLMLRDRKGGDWSEWPADLRIREFPRSAA
jgi:protein gp37